jgi:hypothetical protein
MSDWITSAKANAAWRDRNIALCRMFLTTTMNVHEIAGIFSISGTTVRLILFRFGIPSKRRSAPRPEWEWRRGYGCRRDQLPPDLQALADAYSKRPTHWHPLPEPP